MEPTKVVFEGNQIEAAVKTLAQSINEHYSSLNLTSPLTILTVLNGGVFFYVDLVRHLTIPSEMGVISTSHYPKGSIPNEVLQIKFLDAELENRHVLVLDEICFTGKTLLEIKTLAQSSGALDVRTGVLVHQLKKGAVHNPDWSALQYEGNEWVVGQGMDFKGLYRNSRDIFYFTDKE